MAQKGSNPPPSGARPDPPPRPPNGTAKLLIKAETDYAMAPSLPAEADLQLLTPRRKADPIMSELHMEARIECPCCGKGIWIRLEKPTDQGG